MTVSKNRLGIFGGTFNPIHLGHIQTVNQAASLLSLDSVALLPANIPPHKKQPTIDLSHRLAMLEAVCKQHSRFYIEDFELKQASTSFTVKTLTALKVQQPAQELFFFIGMDSLVNFHLWFEYQEILNLCNLVVSTRPGYDVNQVQEEVKASTISFNAFEQLAEPKPNGQIILMPDLPIDMASSRIRQMIQRNQSVEHLLPLDVHQYIKTHNLYQ